MGGGFLLSFLKINKVFLPVLSQFTMVESLITAIYDEVPSLRNYKWQVVSIVDRHVSFKPLGLRPFTVRFNLESWVELINIFLYVFSPKGWPLGRNFFGINVESSLILKSMTVELHIPFFWHPFFITKNVFYFWCCFFFMVLNIQSPHYSF